MCSNQKYLPLCPSDEISNYIDKRSEGRKNHYATETESRLLKTDTETETLELF